MFIKAFHKRAPVDPIDVTKKTPISGIIYCRSRAMCDQVAEMLRDTGIKARPFHRGLKSHELDKTLQQWLSGEVECVVATIAFGMGIDKPNVRYVVHFDLPKSFEGYYQEIGRAGRDGHISRCLLYYSREDAVRLRRLVNMERGKKRKPNQPVDDEDDTEPDEHSAVDSFKQVQHYAESTTLCRHIAICRYFGEKIDETDKEVAKTYCDNMCDICVHPEKVVSRAKQLTEEVAVASQIPLKRVRDRQEREPVNPVSFYGRNTSPAPRSPSPVTVPQPIPRKAPMQRAMPPPSPVDPPAPPRTVVQQEPPRVSNPYFSGPSLATVRMGIGKPDAGLRQPPQAVRGLPRGDGQKQPKPAIILERSEPLKKKSKVVEPSPYAASPSAVTSGE
jgi:hypothetical protein